MQQQALAALEWPKVLQLVASFAKTPAGRAQVLATVPQFGEQAKEAFQLCRDLWAFVEKAGTLPLEGLKAEEHLQESSGQWSAQTLSALIGLVRTIEDVRRAVLGAQPGPALSQWVSRLPQLAGFMAWCERRLDPSGQIPDSASPALAQARAAREKLRAQLQATLENLAKEMPFASGPYTLRRDRYCLPIPAAQRGRVAGLVLDTSQSGATVFLEPFPLVELNNSLSQVQGQIREEEERILRELAAAFSQLRPQLLAACQVLATLDAFQARVLFGQATGGVLLPPGEGESFRISGARHPLLEPSLAPLRAQVLGEGGNRQPVVPTHLEFPPGVRLLLISGPNAGGKTVLLKTVGLVVAQAFAAIPVLAEENTALPQLSGLFCHIGDEQDVLAELSTFQAALKATAQLLASQEKELLVLYDELGSGTDPEEGQALAAALLEELAQRGWWTVATSHLLALAGHLESIPSAANAAMGFEESTGRPTYRLTLGRPGRSRGLALARACGWPEALVARAESLVSHGSLQLERFLTRLEKEAEALQHARRELARQQEELQSLQKAAAEQARLLAEKQEALGQALQQELAKLRQKAQERWAQVQAELQAARAQGQSLGRRRLAQLRAQALNFGPETPPMDTTPASLHPGDAVRVVGFPGQGQVLAVREGRAEVAIAGKRVWVELQACRPTTPLLATAKVQQQASPPPQELVLLGLDREAAREELEKFLDKAMACGTRQVRIVHGHGTGTLRRLVWEVLKGFPGVASFQHPPQARGGTGVTEVELDL
jgi:DNA mismatch repair protein MutS2